MENDLILVGIGSSAGGLEALQIMLKKIPEIDNCAYIIAQHLSPTHKSMMVDLLGRVTNLPVIEIKNGLKIKDKTIYITPENTDIYVKSGKIYLKNVEQSFGPKPSVNYLFSSIATEFQHKSIGIILSGTGSDGAYGIRAIKASGGLTICQSPATAKYDGMPLAAIDTGKVDFIVKIDELSSEIETIIKSINSNKDFNLNDRVLQQIYKILYDKKGIDFSLYKKTTIIRRIERRIAALRVNSLLEYLDELKIRKDEAYNLFHDILIGVTSFFRDIEAFEYMKTQLEELLKNKDRNEEIRIWSIGCSSGEEPYSLAILLAEILNENLDNYKIKIFATDVSDEALKIARTGIYSETSLINLDKKLIQRYFTIKKNQFEVKKKIRELVVFSNHNIIGDSPFLRQDLIVCRNVLIYFNQILQNKFFPLIHYSLKDSGLLFLGKSESIGQYNNLFNVVEKNLKIYKSQYTGIKEPPKLYTYSYKPFNDTKVAKKDDEELLEDKILEGLKEQLFNKCLVINSSNDIIYIKGEIPYIRHKEGKISNNIFKLIDDNISLDLRNAITNTNKSKKSSLTSYKLVGEDKDTKEYLRIIVTPIKDTKSDDWVNILFFQIEKSDNIKGNIIVDGNDSQIVEKLKKELDTTKENLQNVIEELESSYEEMQTLNEELQSSNEELQSSNEELETTNEELQSTNEELQTAYSELRVLYEDKESRTKQLEELTKKISDKSKDMRKQKEITEGIINTAPTSIIMLDEFGHITYSNTNAEKLFNVSKKELLYKTYSSEDWEITNLIGEQIDDDKLPFSTIKKNFMSIYNFKHIILIDNEKIYLTMNASAMFDTNGKFAGAILCFDDLTSTINLENDLNMYKNSNLNSSTKELVDFFELDMINLNTFVKNELNELQFLVNSKGEDVNLKTVEKRISSISNILEKKIDYFRFSLLNTQVLVKNEIRDTFKEYSEFLLEQNIKVVINIKTTKIKKNKNTLKILNYILIKLLLNIQNILNKEINANISFSKNKLTLTIKNIDLLDYKNTIDNILNITNSQSFIISVNKQLEIYIQ